MKVHYVISSLLLKGDLCAGLSVVRHILNLKSCNVQSVAATHGIWLIPTVLDWYIQLVFKM